MDRKSIRLLVEYKDRPQCSKLIFKYNVGERIGKFELIKGVDVSDKKELVIWGNTIEDLIIGLFVRLENVSKITRLGREYTR
jgi:hypothetical protein